jgi:hypothetical protein
MPVDGPSDLPPGFFDAIARSGLNFGIPPAIETRFRAADESLYASSLARHSFHANGFPRRDL